MRDFERRANLPGLPVVSSVQSKVRGEWMIVPPTSTRPCSGEALTGLPLLMPMHVDCCCAADPLRLANRGFRPRPSVAIFGASWTRVPGQAESVADALLVKSETEEDKMIYVDPNLPSIAMVARGAGASLWARCFLLQAHALTQMRCISFLSTAEESAHCWTFIARETSRERLRRARST